MQHHSLFAFLRLASIVHVVFGAAVFNWPDPLLDSLDEQLYRPFISPASTFALNCGPGQRDNSTISAQWLRLAYHDAATHDSVAGTGGLDASIAFEFDRPQDIGPGMLESLIDFLVAPNEYVGMADVIAMGAVNAVIGCGGPVIPYRGGRIDATEAGPATVPEPQQDLASHIASFKAQGFNQTEMISLVACGHSLGGVRKVDFPLIVTEDVPSGLQNFASGFGFDNTVVNEYLDSTTENVLVVGSNITTRSDLRIFSSDNNVTMQSLASSDTFNAVCADLIERMLNTVPSTVTLTDPIEPIDYKVWNTLLFPQGGSLAFLATLRIIHTGANRTVTMFWKERTGSFCPAQGCSIGTFQDTATDSSFLAQLKGVQSFDLHSFNASIDLTTSISHFWFEVNNNDGSAPFIVDNHGANYTIDQDVLLFDPRRSSFTIAGLTMVVGVRDPSETTTVTSLSTLKGNTTYPVNSSVTLTFELDESHPPADGYTFYSSPINGKSLSNTLHATVNGTSYSLWVPLYSAAGV
ncbi:heme peroxidase [Mycena sanguinolenta]|nr:heme peroxidase [Mycena sanguinolenta]